MAKCGAPDWTPYTAEEDRPVPGGIYPHSVWDLEGITQVLEQATAGNGGNTFYTVPAGKVFYLTALTCGVYTTQAGRSDISCYVRDASYNIYFVFMNMIGNADHAERDLSFFPPLKIPAGWMIRAYASGATSIIDVSIAGYTLPV